MQRVTPGTKDDFGPLKEVLQETFLLALFQGLGEGAPGRGITRLPAEKAGLALSDPTKMAPENWMAPCVIIGHLVEELRG